MVAESGTGESPIRIGAYGEGTKPSIRGSEDFSSPSRWQYDVEGAWFVDDIRERPSVLLRDDRPARERADRDDLVEPWDWHYDVAARRVYVLSDANPAAAADDIEIPVRAFVAGPVGASHLVLEGLDLRHARTTVLMLWKGTNVRVSDCDFSWSGESLVQVGLDSRHVELAGCRFDGWGVAGGEGYGIHVQESGSGPVDVLGCTFSAAASPSRGAAIRSRQQGWIRTVRDCTFEGRGGRLAGAGVWISRPGHGASTIGIEGNRFSELGGSAVILDELEVHGGQLEVAVSRNEIRGAGTAGLFEGAAIRLEGFSGTLARVSVALNMISDTPVDRRWSGILLESAGGVRVLNNLVARTDIGLVAGHGTTNLEVLNTIFLENRGVGILNWTGARVEGSLFHENADPAVPEGNLSAAPMLDEDGRPLPGSPCIDGGVASGLTEDFSGNPIPSGAGPDIGPYEYQEGA